MKKTNAAVNNEIFDELSRLLNGPRLKRFFGNECKLSYNSKYRRWNQSYINICSSCVDCTICFLSELRIIFRKLNTQNSHLENKVELVYKDKSSICDEDTYKVETKRFLEQFCRHISLIQCSNDMYPKGNYALWYGMDEIPDALYQFPHSLYEDFCVYPYSYDNGRDVILYVTNNIFRCKKFKRGRGDNK